MGFSLSKTFKKAKNVVKKVAKPLSYVNPLTYIGYGSDKKALAGYAGAAALAGGGATLLGGLGGATSAGSLAGKGGQAVVGADAALGGGSLLGGASIGSTLGTLANSASSIAPFLSAAGSGYAGYASSEAQKSINDKQLAWAREQSQIQQNASATQYQRAMADMEKAGLNPILAYQQGGAAMPGTVQAPQLGNPVSAGVNSASAVQSAVNQTNQTSQNVSQSKATINQIVQDTLKSEAHTELTHMQSVQVSAAINKIQAEVSKIQAQTEMTEYELVEAGIIAELLEEMPVIAELSKIGVDGKIFVQAYSKALQAVSKGKR